MVTETTTIDGLCPRHGIQVPLDHACPACIAEDPAPPSRSAEELMREAGVGLAVDWNGGVRLIDDDRVRPSKD
jgi:hypothetical protein